MLVFFLPTQTTASARYYFSRDKVTYRLDEDVQLLGKLFSYYIFVRQGIGMRHPASIPLVYHLNPEKVLYYAVFDKIRERYD